MIVNKKTIDMIFITYLLDSNLIFDSSDWFLFTFSDFTNVDFIKSCFVKKGHKSIIKLNNNRKSLCEI